MDRRTFLKGAIAAPVARGFPGIRHAEAGERKDWLAEAFQQMKTDGRPGVVICVPADADQARTLGSIPLDASVALLLESLARHFPEQKDGQGLLLIDVEKRVVEAAALDGVSLTSPTDLLAALARLVHGEGGARLAERAALTPDDAKALDATLAGLGADSYEERNASIVAMTRLAPRDTATLSWIVHEEKDPEVAARIEELFAGMAPPSLESVEGKLPYGAAWSAGEINPFGSRMARAPGETIPGVPLRGRKVRPLDVGFTLHPDAGRGGSPLRGPLGRRHRGATRPVGQAARRARPRTLPGTADGVPAKEACLDLWIERLCKDQARFRFEWYTEHLRLDSHDRPVPEPVWEALDRVVARCPNLRGAVVERLNGTLGKGDILLLREEVRRVGAILGERAC